MLLYKGKLRSIDMNPYERFITNIRDTDRLIRMKSLSLKVKQSMWVRLKVEREKYNATL